MNLCIYSQQYNQLRTFITIILSSDAKSTLQRHPESKRRLSLGQNPKNLEAFSKTQSKGRERHTDNLRDRHKHGLDMTNTKLRDLEGPLKRKSRERYAGDFRNEHTSVKTRSRIADLDKESMKVLGASLEDESKEMMRIDEELRRSFDEVLLKSSQIKSNLKRLISTTKELLVLRGEPRTSSGDLQSDLRNLKKIRDLKSTIAP
ncbi:hypothetical protein BPOR_0640g00040 [Botrytis porri]|uniref:Uncharacterized protein n=1 Tax=Botrytis porri TaxID=87229 RepID=A0A4Z1KBC0_9HELO|nr:hypothetical protein BPOR_0640g00040 [Botrytis porri]